MITQPGNGQGKGLHWLGWVFTYIVAPIVVLLVVFLVLWLKFDVGGPAPVADLIYDTDASAEGSREEIESSLLVIPVADLWEMDGLELEDALIAALSDHLQVSRSWTFRLLLASTGEKPATGIIIEIEPNGTLLSVDVPLFGRCTTDTSSPDDLNLVIVECPSLVQGDSMSVVIRVRVEELDERTAEGIAVGLLRRTGYSTAADLLEVARGMECHNAALVFDDLEASTADFVEVADGSEAGLAPGAVRSLSVRHFDNNARRAPISQQPTYPAHRDTRVTLSSEPSLQPSPEPVDLRTFPWRVSVSQPFDDPFMEQVILDEMGGSAANVFLLLPGSPSLDFPDTLLSELPVTSTLPSEADDDHTPSKAEVTCSSG